MQDQQKLSLYWRCQLIGWSIASLYWSFAGYTGPNFSIWLAIIHFTSDVLIYIGITHIFRTISRYYRWHELQPGPLLLRIIPATAILGIAFMLVTFLKIYLVRRAFEDDFSISMQTYFNAQWMGMLVTGVRLMAIWVLAYYLYHYAQRELRATRESARLALIAKDAQLDNLSSQLNPHFFFNSLNNIKALVLENPHAARRAIDLLSELLRTALYKRDEMLIPLKEEIALVNDYLELEKIRLEERLETNINIDQQLLQTPVPPLSIQTLVENAIKHGISRRREGGKIGITITNENGFLKMNVLNTGQLGSTGRNGLGLNNLVERLDLQFNGKASFELTATVDDHVSATIKIPLA
jgi:sensor histidine kinase YesM